MLTIEADRLFDGESVVEPAIVVVDGNSVAHVGEGVGGYGDVVRLDGMTLVPGLIDCHQHLCFHGQGMLEEQVTSVDDDALIDRARRAARRAAEGGVTTLRDLGDRGFVTLGLRGDASLPTIVASGPPITRPGGHCWSLGGECDSDSALVSAVAERAERGCDVVKVMVTGGALTPTFPMWETQFSRSAMRILVDEAHRRGLPVAAHCHASAGIEMALGVGVDTIEHCTFFSSAQRCEPDLALIERLGASTVVISADCGRVPGAPVSELVARNKPALREARRLLLDAGATVVPGTDAGVNASKPHDVLPHALVDLVEWGMTPLEGLRALTIVAARALGAGEKKGRLAVGFDADIVAVRGNPLNDASALASIAAVWLRGQRIV